MPRSIRGTRALHRSDTTTGEDELKRIYAAEALILHGVDVGERSLKAYRDIAPEAVLERLAAAARDLRNARVLHLNATPYGGGVSELLRAVVPLLNDLGLVTDWKIIGGDEAFFRVTKGIHNGLQGRSQDLSEPEMAAFRKNAEQNARLLEEEYDFVFVHDPQPAAIPAIRGKGSARWVWRCHIDTSNPHPSVWSFLRPYLAHYDAAVFTMREFIPPDFPLPRAEVIPPAIDPLSPKNMPLAEATAHGVLDWLGLRLDRPLISQISRFDPWKDPLGVIEAYKLARREVRGLQLVLAGSMALDDPEGWEVYRAIEAQRATEPGLHLFTNLTGVGNIEVNALQRLSSVVVQKSIREGFGLVVSEAMWKGTPVVAGNAGGIPLQMADGAGGILVDGVDACAAAIVELLKAPGRARELGERGRERVREHFLLPRLLLNELTLMRGLARQRPIRREPPGGAGARDPVCGMEVGQGHKRLETSHDGHAYAFCSEDCRERFLASPARYLVGV